MKTKVSLTIYGLLLLAGMTLATSANAMVTVYGVASSSGELITVNIHANIAPPPIVSFGFKVFYDREQLQVVNASRNEEVWYLSDGSSHIPYEQPDSSVPGEILFLGASMNAEDPMAGVSGDGVLLGTVVFRRSSSATPKFQVQIGREGQFANFVTTTGVVLEALVGEVSFEEVSPTQGDRDLDGLDDRWEVENFEDIAKAYFSDDNDGDGVNNQGEQDLGSDPNDGDSNLHMEIRHGGDVVQLRWTSFQGRSYAVEAGETLDKFETLEEGIKATPPENSIELQVSENLQTGFFRIRLEPLSRQ